MVRSDFVSAFDIAAGARAEGEEATEAEKASVAGDGRGRRGFDVLNAMGKRFCARSFDAMAWSALREAGGDFRKDVDQVLRAGIEGGVNRSSNRSSQPRANGWKPLKCVILPQKAAQAA